MKIKFLVFVFLSLFSFSNLSYAAGADEIVINEVDAQTGESPNLTEFIELYDGGLGNTSLSNLVVVLFNGNTDLSYQDFDLDGYQTDSDGYFVICGDNDYVAECDLKLGAGTTSFIQNGADAVALYEADGADFPNGTAISTNQLIDAVVYGTQDADDAGLLVLLQLGELQLDEAANGNHTTESNQRCDYGARQLRKSWSFVQATATPGSANHCDADNDGMSFGFEIKYGLDTTLDDSAIDSDNDGLTHLEEYNAGTDPLQSDTDRDSLPDGWELENGRDALQADYMVYSGREHTCALDDEGVDCWGKNNVDQLNVPTLQNPVKVSAGAYHNCALDDTGVVCWGLNTTGQTTVPTSTPLENPTLISAGLYHSCALDDTGVVCWGRDNTGQSTVPTLRNPTSVAAGGYHTCALDDTGVVCWGYDKWYQSTVPNLQNPSAISVGYLLSCALDDTGLVCWGTDEYVEWDNEQHNPQTIPPLQNPALVSAGWGDTCAIDDTGVVCWGLDKFDLSILPSFNNPVSLSLGENHSCVLDDTGVVCWGGDYVDQLSVPALMIDPDGDGVSNDTDAFPFDSTRNVDGDSDGDGINDSVDICPEDSTAWTSNTTTDANADGCQDTVEILVINEIDADTANDPEVAEFIELFNGGTANSALDGFVLVLYNGNGDFSYAAYDLDGYTTDANGYFVICGDSASVASCDYDLADTYWLQNGADAVALYVGDAVDFPFASAISTTNLVDAVVYGTSDFDDAELLVLLNNGQPQVDENAESNSAYHSSQRCDNGSGGSRNTSTFGAAIPTPGASNVCELSSIVTNICGDPATLISSVQGEIIDVDNDASPMEGLEVEVEAIVVAGFQGGFLANGDTSTQYKGFWLQEEDADSDGNSATSEGIFVYNTSYPVEEGDQVRLTAYVKEFAGITELTSVSQLSICSNANPLPMASPLSLPVNNLTELEALEGMLVTSTQDLVVSDLYGTYYGLGNYGQFAVSSSLLYAPTEIATPGSVEYDVAVERRTLDYLLIDDGVSTVNPSFIPYPDNSGLSADNPMRIGYTVSGLNGVMHAYYNNYIVVPKTLTINADNPRTTAPVVDASADLIIASMNMLNYFNGNGDGTGFPTSRGASTAEGFSMQRQKIIAALNAMDADVIGIMELENDGYDALSAIQDLVNGLNTAEADTNKHYRFVEPSSSIGSNAITVGMLYRAEKLTKTGTTAVLDSNNSPTDSDGVLYDSDSNRPTLIQSFDFNGYGFTVAVSHLKSKGSACGEVDEGEDGQGNCNITRTRAAQGLAEYLATDPTSVGNENVLIIGDLNTYSQEDPMQVFDSAGYQNLKYSDASTEDQPYSFSYGGLLGSLDHALASDELSARTVSVDVWHINSVEDELMGYETDMTGDSSSAIDVYANADPYRSSDHDPIVIGINSLLSLDGGSSETTETTETTETSSSSKKSGSGSMDFFMLLGFIVIGILRRYQTRWL